ncbi:MAG: iron(III) transport system permease protein [Kribbellaceae bacterium]|jgi:iron(III) transport system permease protein|nr:iron(III) transport system permease protein [Kribbellaceae bacterium]
MRLVGHRVNRHRANRPEWTERCAAALVVLLLVGLVVLPVFRLIRTVVAEGDPLRVLAAADTRHSVVNTVVLAIVVTLASVPIGAAMALALQRGDVPGRGALRLVVLLPLLVPQFVLGYSWTQAYGRAGLTDAVLGVHWPAVLGPVGVGVVLVVNAVPLVYLVSAAGLAIRAEPDLERAARLSGAGPWTALRTVTLPLLRPALAAAAVLTFVATLESFAVPQVMGAPAGFSTVTTRIYSELSLGGDPASFAEAVTLALVLVLLAAVVITPADLVLGPRLRVRRTGQQAGAAVVRRQTAGGRAVATVLWVYLGFGVAIPTVALLAAALTRAVGLPPTPANWTLDNFTAVVDRSMLVAVGRSLVLAAAAATLLTVLGALVAVVERRRRAGALGSLVTFTLVLPGSTLALAVLIAYGRWIGGTLSIILVAYLAKLWALAHRPVAGGLDRLPPEELRAARSSGASLLAAVRTVALRPLAPVLLGGWLLVFVTALHEVTMSSLLYGPRSETLAVVVLNSQELGQVGSTAALSVLLGLLLLLPALSLWPVFHRLRRVSHG